MTFVAFMTRKHHTEMVDLTDYALLKSTTMKINNFDSVLAHSTHFRQ
jgi:uncharacterized protein (DUF305 family)